MILAVLLAGGGWAAWRLWPVPRPRPATDVSRWADGRPATLVGRVAGPPAGVRGGDGFVLEIHWLSRGDVARPVTGRVSVVRRAPETPFLWGDEVTLWGPLSRPRAAAAPGLFDGRRWDERRGVGARLFAPPGKSWLVRRASPGNPVRWVSALRERCLAVFDARLTPEAAAVLSGLVLGRRSGLSPEMAADFRRAGMTHLLVASGSNVGFALGLWWVCARWLLFWPRRGVLAAVPFWAFFYAGMAGGDPPVLRAALMASAGALGALGGRWDRLEQPLFLSAGIILARRPDAVFDAGFQMSYAATLGLTASWLSFSPSVDEGPRPPLLRRWGAGVGRNVLRLLLVSASAQLALAPLLLHYFGRFSLVGIVSNVVAVPAAGLCLGLGAGLFVTAELGLESLAVPGAAVTGAAVRGMAAWARFCGGLPGAEWRCDLGLGGTALLAALVILFFVLASGGRRRGPALLGVAALGLGTVAGAAFVHPRPPGLRVVWWENTVLIQRASADVLLELGRPVDDARLDSFLRGQGRRRPVKRLTVPLPGEGGPAPSFPEGLGTVYAFPEGGRALLLEDGGPSVLLALALTAADAREMVRRAPRTVDAVGWWPRAGVPRAAEALRGLAFRSLVFQGRRPPRAVLGAAMGAGVFLPARGAVAWNTERNGARLSLPAGVVE